MTICYYNGRWNENYWHEDLLKVNNWWAWWKQDIGDWGGGVDTCVPCQLPGVLCILELSLFGDGVLAERACLSSWISCRWERQIADSFSYFDVISVFSEYVCASCSFSLSTSASNPSFPVLFCTELSLLLSKSATKVLKASFLGIPTFSTFDVLGFSDPQSLSSEKNLILKSSPLSSSLFMGFTCMFILICSPAWALRPLEGLALLTWWRLSGLCLTFFTALSPLGPSSNAGPPSSETCESFAWCVDQNTPKGAPPPLAFGVPWAHFGCRFSCIDREDGETFWSCSTDGGGGGALWGVFFACSGPKKIPFKACQVFCLTAIIIIYTSSHQYISLAHY